MNNSVKDITEKLMGFLHLVAVVVFSLICDFFKSVYQGFGMGWGLLFAAFSFIYVFRFVLHVPL